MAKLPRLVLQYLSRLLGEHLYEALPSSFGVIENHFAYADRCGISGADGRSAGTHELVVCMVVSIAVCGNLAVVAASSANTSRPGDEPHHAIHE